MNRQSSDASGEGTSLPRIPKKKKFYSIFSTGAEASSVNDSTNNNEPTTSTNTTTTTNNKGGDSKGKKGGESITSEVSISVKPEKVSKLKTVRPSGKSKAVKSSASISRNSSQKEKLFDPPILRKGDLVRLSNKQKSGRIQGGLARITRSHFSPDDADHAQEPLTYDIEYVLGGKLSNLERCDLDYTTATAEGLVDATDNCSRGHLLRRRRTASAAASASSEAQKEKEKDKEAASNSKGRGKKGKESQSSTADPENETTVKRKPGRPPSMKSARAKREAAATAEMDDSSTPSKKRRSSKGSDVDSTSVNTAGLSPSEVKSQAAKAGWEKRRKAAAEAAAAREAAIAAAKQRRAASKSKSQAAADDASDTGSTAGMSTSEIRSHAAKAGWEKRRNAEAAKAAKSAGKQAAKSVKKPAGAKSAASSKPAASKIATKPASKSALKRSNSKLKRSSTADASIDSSDANSAAELSANTSAANDTAASTDGNNKSRRMDMYVRHRREMEKSLGRLEKVDRFGFFLDNPPPEFDENYDDDDDEEEETERVVFNSGRRRNVIQFPETPPFNFLVIRKRFEAGRYDLDRVALEQTRQHEIKAMLLKSDANNDEKQKAESNIIDYDELARQMQHPIAVDWETFNLDITSMCDAAMARDPDGISVGAGHLGWAASKIKKMMQEIYNIYGEKRMLEVEESEAKGRYDRVLIQCNNMEAAMQGKWRTAAFPERKYERLETSSVICDGLSPKDRSYAMYELETKLPDSFVGLAYTYDDSGQHSETWMKTVADETSGQPAKASKPKRKKKNDGGDGDSADSSLVNIKNRENKAKKAAMALAKDDGVVRAQVQTTMTTLLIQVQDKVMTDLGVMHAPEARSANWDDGDDMRDYKGSNAGEERYEVEQGTHSGFSLPEVAEQEVWGIDCYTRKNVMALIEEEFSSEIATEFVQKWLLPAINSCPVDLAYKMSTASKILEGLQPTLEPAEKCRRAPTDNNINSSVEDAVNKPPKDADQSGSKQQQSDEVFKQPDDNENSHQESSVFLRNALVSKIHSHAPPWLKPAARLIRLASDSMDDDFFRIHPKGHGSVVIGEDGLKANSLVTYYRGEVYPAWRWCEKLDAIETVQKKLNLRPNLPDFYNMAMERPKKDPRGYCLLFVDASRKSGLGSSFSHSCNPTCEVRVVSLNGKLSLSMTTLRDLEQGEELTFDYNAVTESLNEFRFAICLCGQRNCRGSFLHFATADCYQQVLSRNSPISARFANLVRGCMKQVMSKEDSELLLKHGFNTAAFGAVSFNHHVTSYDSDNDASPDSVENVPIWLRTFVADCLRYIEYERRALPVALLCNQMERMEEKLGKGKSKKTEPKKDKLDRQSSIASASEKSSKAISGSKPMTSYFFFLQSQRNHWEIIARAEHEGPDDELKGLELSRAINRVASKAWSNFDEQEKQSWRKKSIADWKKNGGKEKAKMEEERKKGTLKKPPKEAPNKTFTEKQKEKQKVDKDLAKDESKNTENKPSPSKQDVGNGMEAKTISFADADAEGFSAMEQRIQQLAQSLSRVGRVLDRHRESVFAETKDCDVAVDSDLLCKLVPSPLKIMSDEEVVNWLWSDPNRGVVPHLFSMAESHFPKKSLLRELLVSTKKMYPVLSAFSQNYSVPCLEKKFKHSCTAADARRLVREALLKFRSNIIEFLNFAEKSNAESRNELRREKARAREEKKKLKLQNCIADACPSSPGDDRSERSEEVDSTADDDKDVVIESMDNNGMPHDRYSTQGSSIFDSESYVGDEAMSMRGGGECASADGLAFDSQMLDQASSLRAVGPEPTVRALAEVDEGILMPPPGINANNGQQPKPAIVHSAVCEDVESLMQLSQVAYSKVGKSPDEDPPASSGQNAIYSARNIPTIGLGSEIPAKAVLHSPSKFQDLIDAAGASNGKDGRIGTSTLESHESTPVGKDQNNNFGTPNPSSALAEDLALPATPMSVSSQDQTIANTSTSSPAETPKKTKKKVPPLKDSQVDYLKDWLFDPKHILNPYPTDEEKSIMMKEIGIERKRLDGWFMKNRQRVLCPEVRKVPMGWKQLDQDHWIDWRKNRYMLEATADLLLMYASTNTFFLLEPFRQFDSTPIEVYARELGNEVPRHFALNCQKESSAGDVSVSDAVDSDGDVLFEKLASDRVIADKPSSSTKKTKAKKEGATDEEPCSPEDVIDQVAVDYSGEYVLSQLLQWVNGGIGQMKGLPDVYGCVMLPPLSGCWEEIKCNEVKLPNYTKWNCKTTTEYDAHARNKLAEWIMDRYQRGSPWEKELAKYFCPQNAGVSPDPSMPMGSPIIDYLVTGNDANILTCAAALSTRASTSEQGIRSKEPTSATDRLQHTVDEGMPAQAVANWVQCENPNCLKWRKLPWHVDVDLLPENFFCKDNIWNVDSQHCDASEDEWDMDDAPIKFDTKDDNYEVGAWFDVQREGKVAYHEAQVMEIDFESNVKRVKFHFWKLSGDRDEWIEVGSPRIAPHHSYTPRPLDGYGAPKNKKTSEKKKISSNPSSSGPGTLPQKRKIDDVASTNSSSQQAEGATDGAAEDNVEGAADETKRTVPFSESTIAYLNDWITQHATNPFPSTGDKVKIIADTGLSKRQVGDWMARARKKLKQKLSQPEKEHSAQEKRQPAKKPIADVMTMRDVSSSPTKVENLLLQLRNGNAPPTPIKQNTAVPDSGKAKQIAVPLQGSPISSNNSIAGTACTQSALNAESGVENKSKTTIKELETYMKAWLSRPENANNLMPTLGQKEKIIQETGIEKKRLEGWFFRARKKLKKQHGTENNPEPTKTDDSQVLQPLPVMSLPTTSTTNHAVGLVSDTAPAVQHQDLPKQSGTIMSIPHSGLNISPMVTSKTSQNKPISQMKPAAATVPTTPIEVCKASQNMTISTTTSPIKDEALANPKNADKGLIKDEALANPKKVDKGLTEESKTYLNTWLSEHASNPYPTREEKDAMMKHLCIVDARKLEGWFCRARKRLKKSTDKDKELNGGKDHDNSKSLNEDTPNPSGHSVDRPKTQTEKSSASVLMEDSPFASLLSAAELHDERQSGNTTSTQQIESSGFSREDGSNQYPQQQTQMQPPSYGSQHGFSPPSPPPSDGNNTHYRNLGPRERAILSSFQSLQSMEIHDRSSRRASPDENTPSYQPSQSQRQASTADYSSYQPAQGHQHGAPAAEYQSLQHSQHDHYQQAPPTDHSSYQHSQSQQQAPPPDYAPYHQREQGQHDAPPPNYSSYHQHSQGQQQAPSHDYSSYQHSQGQSRASPADHAHYQHSQGHQRASPVDYVPPYQHSQTQQQAPRGAYQHSQGQQPSQGYVYPPASAPNPQQGDHGFHPGNMAYGQHNTSTYQR